MDRIDVLPELLAPIRRTFFKLLIAIYDVGTVKRNWD